MFKDFEFTLHNGRVLSQFSVLKKDDGFNYKLDCDKIKIEGAPGFHGSNKIYSLGQPTLVGIENIIKFLGNKKIVWINLKEEPTIYINNLPYIVREKNNPFSNISSFKSITSRNLEILENVLKEDVLNESQKGFIHTFEETQDMKLENKITYLYEIMTNQEIYYHLKSKGYKINYYRVPFPVGQFFSVCQSMNILIDVLEKHRDDDCIFLLTSSNDTKRSLFVLILIKLFYLKSEKIKKILSQAKEENDNFIGDEKSTIRSLRDGFVGLNNNSLNDNSIDLKDNNINLNNNSINLNDNKNDSKNDNIFSTNEILTTLDDDSENFTVKDLDLDNFEDFIISSIKKNWLGSENEIYLILKQCLDGNFRIINNILLVIGEDSKILVDYFIDKHSFPLNLRKKITFDYLKASINNEEGYYNKAMLSLERYLALILFDQFMKDYDNQSNIDYISWLNHKPILMNLLDYINEHRHINKALFPLNLLNSEIRSNLFQGMSKIGKFTMLMEFTDKIYNSFGNGIILNSYPDNSTTTGIWINTREEPCIYINGKMYILKEMINYQSNPTFFSGITNEQIEQLEKQIKENLIQESSKEGKILLFRSSEEDIEEFYIDKKDLNKIETSKEYTERVVSKDVSYNRVLITAKIALKITIFDQISSVLGENTFDYYNIQCGGGGSRGAYTAIIIDLKLGLSNDFLGKKTFIKPIHSLIRILKKGKESFDKVNYLYSKYFGESFVVSSDISDKELEARIKNMFLLVCFASFCLLKIKGSFLDFYNKRKDVQNLFNSIDLQNNKEEIFIVVQNETLENINVIKNRTGKVLGPMTLLKSDYFVGSIVLEQDKESNLPGNFRFIIDKNIIYAGSAMPTQPGVESALKEIQKNLKEKINPLWICLREEPVIYCDGSPYALRYVTKLCENIETTGISYGTLEIVEDELCLDAKNELKRGNILLHNEVMRNGKVIDLGRYVKVDNCETVTNFFSKFKMEFLRIPVTDETAPSPKSIDFFISKLKKCKNINAYIFNCQMGRGRTTTTMIIFYLINNRNKTPKDLPSYPPKYKLIGRIIQVLPNSHLSKRFLDFVIDKFDHIENVRNAIDRHLVNNFSIRKRGKSYLLRYLDLIVFTEFILFGKEKTYQLFREGHPEIESIVKEIEVFELEMI